MVGKLATVIGAMALAGCATMSDRPSLERIDAWFARPKYVVEFESTKSPSELIDGLKASGCLSWSITSSGTAVVGPNAYAPVSVNATFTAAFGAEPDGSVWASLDYDASMVHDTALGVKAFPIESGSRVLVTPVKLGMNDQIKSHLEAGTLLCNWETFADRWRL